MLRAGRYPAMAFVLALLLAACTSGSSATDNAQAPDTPAATPAPPTPASPSAIALPRPTSTTAAQESTEPEPPPTKLPAPTPSASVVEEVRAPIDQPWQWQGHVNAIAYVTAFRFNVDDDPPTFAELFFRDDAEDGQTLHECFDRETRLLVGDDTVEQTNLEPDDAQQYEPAGAEALLRCIDPQVVRDTSLAALVDSWNLYGPDGFPASIDDPCVQAIYPAETRTFAVDWIIGGEPREGSCLYQRFQYVDADTQAEAEATAPGDTLRGTRGLTLQWISWEPEDWGSIEFTPLGNERYSVKGQQRGTDGSLVEVDGLLTRVSATELRLSGEVITRVPFIDGGAICRRSGEISFVATDDRRFWRMQDLLSCDGSSTDYVDIYFG